MYTEKWLLVYVSMTALSLLALPRINLLISVYLTIYMPRVPGSQRWPLVAVMPLFLQLKTSLDDTC